MNSKILLLNNNFFNNRKKKIQKINKETIEKIQNQINYLKNPEKGQIYIHIENEDQYRFFQFNGKKWHEIK